MKTTTTISLALFLTVVLLGVMKATKKTENSYKEKSSQFECGFAPMTPPHLPFSFQFFLVAILFLIFDVEISMVLSYPLEPKTPTNTNLILAFLSILLIGLLYEWKKGKIDWSK